ncbi:MAG: NAD(P)-dependent oxidoreductase [Rhodospirillaceae bacterium]|nr:NAD(P)-dependent oxidoreductase [Rhodospirillaceae bacterium]
MSGLVLLTGATGFVGRQVLRSLGDLGRHVRLIVRSAKAEKIKAEPYIESIVTTPNLFSESVEWWAQRCQGVDTVVHVAWYAEPGQYLQSPKNLECLAGTLSLAAGAVQAGIHRFVGVGTCFEYELTGRPLSTNTPLRPTTPYSAAKAAAYFSLSQFFLVQKVSFAWCRLFYLYGEGEDARRLVPHLHAKLAAGQPAELTSGAQVRDFMDVRDAGREIAAVALGEHDGAFNICSGIPITVRQLAEQVADQYGRRDLLKFGARPDNLLDPPHVVGIKGQG